MSKTEQVWSLRAQIKFALFPSALRHVTLGQCWPWSALLSTMHSR